MPNHFHLIVKEVKEGGISAYMQRVLNAYTKYYNAKHDTSGHLFQGPFRAIHIADNDQLLYVSAYIHLNCREINQKREIIRGPVIGITLDKTGGENFCPAV